MIENHFDGDIVMDTDFLNLLKNKVDNNELQQLLKTMIAIESHNSNPLNEEPIAEFISECLKANGIDSKLIKVDEHRYNVLSVLKGDDSSHSLMLTGHLDTVGDYGFRNLFTPFEKDGKIYGRGACDMKGSIASMIETVFTIKRAKITLPYDLKLLFVVDEEFKSIGTESFIKSSDSADMAVLGEPTKLEICAGNRGLEWLDITVYGKETHGGTPEKGINAILMASRLIERINKELVPKLTLKEHPILGKAIMNIGAINGGFQPSSVPSRCVIKIDRRWIYGESVNEVISQYQEIIDELHNEDENFYASIERNSTNMNEMEHGPCFLELEHPLIKLATKSYEMVKKQSPSIKAFPGWTDASLLSNFGKIPTLILGPGDIAVAHSEREFISTSELYDAVLIYAMMALNFKP